MKKLTDIFVGSKEPSTNSLWITKVLDKVKLKFFGDNGWEDLNTGDVTSEELDDFEEFDATTLYSKGDVVRYNGKLYEFTTDHEGEWNEDDAEQTNVFTLLTNYTDSNIEAVNSVLAYILLDILGLKNAMTLLGDLRVRNLSSDNVPKVCGFPFVLIANGAPSATNVPLNWDIETMGQWTGVPCFEGQVYVDKTNHKFYGADECHSVSDFRVLN